MYVYITIAILIYSGFFLKNNSKTYLKFLMIVLFLFTALHNPYITGTDGISFRNYFQNFIPTLSEFSSYSHNYEVGYAFLNSLSKTIKDDYFTFQFIYCAISTLLLWYVIEKTDLENCEKYLFLFVYFTFRYFQNSMEFLRQNIAILLTWLALLSIEDRYKKYTLKSKEKYLYIIPAWSFHRSSIFNIVIFPLIEIMKKIDKKKLLIFTGITSFICLGMSTTVINKIISFAISIGGERYSKYFIDGTTEVRGINMINYSLRWVFFILFIIVFEWIDYRKKNTIIAISSIAIICGSIDVEIFTRMLEFYMIGIYLCIVKSREFINEHSRKIYDFIVFIVFMIILIRNLHTVSSGTYMNYELYPF